MACRTVCTVWNASFWLLVAAGEEVRQSPSWSLPSQRAVAGAAVGAAA